MLTRGGGIEILCCVDNNPKRWEQSIQIPTSKGTKTLEIKNPEILKTTSFDKILIASLSGYEAIPKQLQSDFKIPREKIDTSYCMLCIEARLAFLEYFSKITKNFNLGGAVAELGVFQGDFAKKINEFFPNRKLYLFDTFEGFDTRDLHNEAQSVQALGSHLTNTSIDLVFNKMPIPEMVTIKQGWFPESAKGIESEIFCFVNIDTDLYDSILSGLEFFYPKMCKGGVILIHDYFSLGYIGVKKAVDTFANKYNLYILPIGDSISVAIMKV
ncbi:TylF/MycF/NovP-related O-methyltransferase [Helicobacter himalayensis]|uniref:TylF/MycF/NovP-related O-methyltransferase n=1 Tax=Helicobacter himalayensis TaxID=1591088 RepID=UPI003D6EFC7F